MISAEDLAKMLLSGTLKSSTLAALKDLSHKLGLEGEGPPDGEGDGPSHTSGPAPSCTSGTKNGPGAAVNGSTAPQGAGYDYGVPMLHPSSREPQQPQQGGGVGGGGGSPGFSIGQCPALIDPSTPQSMHLGGGNGMVQTGGGSYSLRLSNSTVNDSFMDEAAEGDAGNADAGAVHHGWSKMTAHHQQPPLGIPTPAPQHPSGGPPPCHPFQALPPSALPMPTSGSHPPMGSLNAMTKQAPGTPAARHNAPPPLFGCASPNTPPGEGCADGGVSPSPSPPAVQVHVGGGAQGAAFSTLLEDVLEGIENGADSGFQDGPLPGAAMPAQNWSSPQLVAQNSMPQHSLHSDSHHQEQQQQQQQSHHQQQQQEQPHYHQQQQQQQQNHQQQQQPHYHHQQQQQQQQQNHQQQQQQNHHHHQQQQQQQQHLMQAQGSPFHPPSGGEDSSASTHNTSSEDGTQGYTHGYTQGYSQGNTAHPSQGGAYGTHAGNGAVTGAPVATAVQDSWEQLLEMDSLFESSGPETTHGVPMAIPQPAPLGVPQQQQQQQQAPSAQHCHTQGMPQGMPQPAPLPTSHFGPAPAPPAPTPAASQMTGSHMSGSHMTTSHMSGSHMSASHSRMSDSQGPGQGATGTHPQLALPSQHPQHQQRMGDAAPPPQPIQSQFQHQQQYHPQPQQQSQHQPQHQPQHQSQHHTQQQQMGGGDGGYTSSEPIGEGIGQSFDGHAHPHALSLPHSHSHPQSHSHAHGHGSAHGAPALSRAMTTTGVRRTTPRDDAHSPCSPSGSNGSFRAPHGTPVLSRAMTTSGVRQGGSGMSTGTGTGMPPFEGTPVLTRAASTSRSCLSKGLSLRLPPLRVPATCDKPRNSLSGGLILPGTPAQHPQHGHYGGAINSMNSGNGNSNSGAMRMPNPQAQSQFLSSPQGHRPHAATACPATPGAPCTCNSVRCPVPGAPGTPAPTSASGGECLVAAATGNNAASSAPLGSSRLGSFGGMTPAKLEVPPPHQLYHQPQPQQQHHQQPQQPQQPQQQQLHLQSPFYGPSMPGPCPVGAPAAAVATAQAGPSPMQGGAQGQQSDSSPQNSVGSDSVPLNAVPRSASAKVATASRLAHKGAPLAAADSGAKTSTDNKNSNNSTVLAAAERLTARGGGDDERPPEGLGQRKSSIGRVHISEEAAVALREYKERMCVRHRRGKAMDSQSVAARKRRATISHGVKKLQAVIPGGKNLDTARVLDRSVEYVMFLEQQVMSIAEDKGTDILATFEPSQVPDCNPTDMDDLDF